MKRKSKKPRFQFVVDVDRETALLIFALAKRWKRTPNWIVENAVGGSVFDDAFRSDVLDDDNKLTPVFAAFAEKKLAAMKPEPVSADKPRVIETSEDEGSAPGHSFQNSPSKAKGGDA